MRDLHGLAPASTPAYLTVCKRGGGTLVAKRQSRDSGPMSTATVPSAYAFLSVMRTKPSGGRSTRCCATEGEPIERGAQRLVVGEGVGLEGPKAAAPLRAGRG